MFSKIQGIPFTARRTRVLKQDPTNENIVYAGTTEGLWKTVDLGKSWKRVSNPEVVVNDVFVDPRDSNHVLIATDRSGVMASTNGAATWETSNHGYTHRYVSALLADNQNAHTLYVGLVNDREYGGVFYSHDNGQHWMQKAAGLGGRDVFALKQTPNGTLVAGTNRGIFYLEHNGTRMASDERGRDRAKPNPFTRKGSKKPVHHDHLAKSRTRSPGQRSRTRFAPLARRHHHWRLHQHRRGQDLAWRPGPRTAGFRQRPRPW